MKQENYQIGMQLRWIVVEYSGASLLNGFNFRRNLCI